MDAGKPFVIMVAVAGYVSFYRDAVSTVSALDGKEVRDIQAYKTAVESAVLLKKTSSMEKINCPADYHQVTPNLIIYSAAVYSKFLAF